MGSNETWYVRDATVNLTSVYTEGDSAVNNGELTQSEVHLYGSSRLGINTLAINVKTIQTPEMVNLPGLGSGFNTNLSEAGSSLSESNHLRNVLATVSDRKDRVSLDNTTIDHYDADIVSAQEYYPFEMQMPGRGFSSDKYRYGFNGKENDNEVKVRGISRMMGLGCMIREWVGF